MSIWKVLVSVLALLLAFSVALPTVGQMESDYDLVAAFDAYLEVWNTSDFILLEDVVTNDFVRHSQWEGDVVGREALAQVITGFQEAMGPAILHPIEEAVIHGDFLWLKGSAELPDTSEPMYYQALARFENGVLAEMWAADDAILLLDLLGVMPAAAQEVDLEANKALVKRFVEEFWNAGNLSVANELVSDDFMAHFADKHDEDWDTYLINTWSWLRTVFPDMAVIPTVMIADGDMVATAGLWGGSFTGGEDFDLIPTGEAIWVSNMDFFRIENGKIAELWDVSNTISMSEQFGFVESEDEVKAEVAWDVTFEPSNVFPEERRMQFLADTLAVNSLDVDQLVGGYTADAKIHWIPMGVELEGLEALRESWAATPPQHRIAPRITVMEGNLAATLYTMFPYVEGVPGLRTEMAVLNRFEGDKMAEEWAIWDEIGLIEQLTGSTE